MNNQNLRVTAAAVLTAAAFTACTASADQFKSVYFYPAARYSFSDPGRLANNSIGYQFSLGYAFDRRWGVELFSDNDRFKLLDNSGILHTRGVGVQGLFNLSPDTDVSPLVLFGSGWLRTDLGVRQEDAPVVRGGLGLSYQPQGKPIGVRADAVVRHEFQNALTPGRDNYDDVTYSLGLTYRFGLAPPDSVGADYLPSPVVAYPPANTQQSAAVPSIDASAKAGRSSFRGRLSNGVSSANDQDGDGVANTADKCSDTPARAVIDVDGCIIYIKKT